MGILFFTKSPTDRKEVVYIFGFSVKIKKSCTIE
jgi:hypothetical protein